LKPNEVILDALRDAASNDLGDFFEFQVGASTMDLENSPYGGGRFPVDARIDGRTFVKFHVEIGVGDSCIEPFEKIAIKDWLAFAGIPSDSVLAISQEQQFAEKLHAYTLPRENNSRVKDLVDMLLLISEGDLEAKKTKTAVIETFERRDTHTIPTTLMPPPATWGASFSVMAKECHLSENMNNAFLEVQNFFSVTFGKENKK
jgi:hypothetical protein